MTNLRFLSPKNQPQLHWLVAMYPKASPASGSKDSQLMDWYQRILQTAATLREPCNLQAVILIGPLRIPDTARALRTEALFGKPGRIGSSLQHPPWWGHRNPTSSPLPRPTRSHGTMGAATSYCGDGYWDGTHHWSPSPTCHDP
jgi:hypothetical protein